MNASASARRTLLVESFPRITAGLGTGAHQQTKQTKQPKQSKHPSTTVELKAWSSGVNVSDGGLVALHPAR